MEHEHVCAVTVVHACVLVSVCAAVQLRGCYRAMAEDACHALDLDREQTAHSQRTMPWLRRTRRT